MSYFTQEDHENVLDLGQQGEPLSPALQATLNRMKDLHRLLYPRMTQHRIDLFPNPEANGNVTLTTLTTPFQADAASIIYTRERAKAAVVENMMGRDKVGISEEVHLYHHPVVEVRLTRQYLVTELVIPPMAWFDQQNFAGKIALKQHRDDFYKLLEKVRGHCWLGFWSGIQPGDSHIDLFKLPPKSILNQYLETFAPGRDLFRAGYWYTPDVEEISDTEIVNTLFDHIRTLFQLYRFIIWTSDNNFQGFYKQALSRA